MALRVVRAGGPDDLDALTELSDLAGPGFTSLQSGDRALAARLEKSQASFQSRADEQSDGVFCLMLEDSDSGSVVGTSAIKAEIGRVQPYVDFRVSTVTQYSDVADRFFDMQTLMLVTECAGASEVGTLFLRTEARGGGMGHLIAGARYMLMAAAPNRFGEEIVSELRGWVDENGYSPFWEALGRKFFDMEFQEADTLSARRGNQFIWDLVPRHPIHVGLLPPDAQKAIAQTHPEGLGARRLLEAQGFEYGGLVDVFDAGPVLKAVRDELTCLRESKRAAVQLGKPGEGAKRAMISNDDVADFRCCLGRVGSHDGQTVVTDDVAEALGLISGDEARIWITE